MDGGPDRRWRRALVAVRMSYSKLESIGLTILIFNVPGLVVGLIIGWFL